MDLDKFQELTPEHFLFLWILVRMICHNPRIWRNCSQVKLTSEESCQRTNCKTKYKLESQNPLGNNRGSVTWKQSYHCHLRKIVPVSLEKKRASVNWEQSCQCHSRTMMPVSLGNNRASLTCEQLCQSFLGSMTPVSLGNNCTNVTWLQSCQYHLEIIVIVSLENICAKVT